jgi:DNA-directed RNA polymerase specialized sigma24 family protein
MSMSTRQTGSVTDCIEALKRRDPAAAQWLWDRYFRRMVGLARKKLQGAPCYMANEEDVALSAFHCLCRGAEQGTFPLLSDRDDLWRLLAVLTSRKAIKLKLHELRDKRGGGKVCHASALVGDSSVTAGLDRFPGRVPTPELPAEVIAACSELLDALGDDTLRSVAVAKLEGFTNQEIARQLGFTVRSIERKLGIIRLTWQKENAR